MSQPLIRPALESDATQVTSIYNPYVVGTTISFEEVPVSVQDMLQRMREVQDASLPYLVIEDAKSAVIGYSC